VESATWLVSAYATPAARCAVVSPDPDEFPRLRVDLPLLPGYVMTVEPGIYFAPALLHDREFRERHRDAVDWDRAEAMVDFG
jgi:hypothetical protein